MADNPALAAALANPAPPDGPPVEMAVVQVRERPARMRKDENGADVVGRPAVMVGTVHQTVMLPERTSFQPPADTALVPAAGLKAGDLATPEQLAPVLGAAQGVNIAPLPLQKPIA